MDEARIFDSLEIFKSGFVVDGKGCLKILGGGGKGSEMEILKNVTV